MSNNLSISSIQSKVNSISRFPSKEGIELENSSRVEYPLILARIELENLLVLLGLGYPPLLLGLGLANLLRLP